MPLVEAKALREPHVIVDGKSGASGSWTLGRSDLIVAEASDNFHAYAAEVIAMSRKWLIKSHKWGRM